MSHPKISIFRIYGFALIASLFLFALVSIKVGLEGFFTVLVLAGLETTFSFDNAIVNARILERMSRFWQTIFMTVGIFIAVFVVRVLLPIVIVSITSATAFRDVVQSALHDSAAYSEKLLVAQPLIASFGGVFLLMLFLDFVFTDRHIKWIVLLETQLARAGQIKHLSSVLATTILVLVSLFFVPNDVQFKVLVAGLIGLGTYLLIQLLDSFAEQKKPGKGKKSGSLRAGLIGFLYLELIDASFSLDGVIGAFALTKNILLIAAGLGIGALFVRSMTVHVMRRGVLAKYRYLEHGAHYAIGILAVLMLVSIRVEVPEFITGGAGLLVIITAIVHSHREARQQHVTPLI